MAYRVRSGCKLHWANWNDEYVIFDEASGQSHQMNLMGAFVIDRLTQRTLAFEDIFEELKQFPAFLGAVDLSGHLQALMNDLGTHGLVEATDS